MCFITKYNNVRNKNNILTQSQNVHDQVTSQCRYHKHKQISHVFGYHVSLVVGWSINFATFTEELGCSPGASLVLLPTLVEPSFHPFLLLPLVPKDLLLADEAVSQLHQVGLSLQCWKNNVKGHVGSSYIRINPCVVA